MSVPIRRYVAFTQVMCIHLQRSNTNDQMSPSIPITTAPSVSPAAAVGSVSV